MATVGVDDLEKLRSLRASGQAQEELVATQDEAVVTFAMDGGFDEIADIKFSSAPKEIIRRNWF